METCKKYFVQYREVILYIIFGALTTLINIGTYWILRRLSLENLPSNIIAWILSVLFAFITNKQYVFRSKEKHITGIMREMVTFFACRGGSGLLDMGIMYFFVDVMMFADMPVKIASNIIVIIMNYVLSKLLVFRSKKDENA